MKLTCPVFAVHKIYNHTAMCIMSCIVTSVEDGTLFLATDNDYVKINACMSEFVLAARVQMHTFALVCLLIEPFDA